MSLFKKTAESVNSLSYKSIFFIFGLAFASIALNSAYTGFYKSDCVGICTQNLNAKFNAEGSILKREGSPTSNMIYASKSKLQKNKVFVVDYDTGFTTKSSRIFASKLDHILGAAISGDKVVVNITSPGGSALACASDFNKLYSLRGRDIEVIATVDYAALSCGYYLASAANVIVADRGAWVGNIGAVLVLPDQSKNKKTAIGSTRVKELLGGGAIKSKDDLKVFKTIAIMSFNSFKSDVISGRDGKLKENDYPTIFSAYPFNGEIGVKLGLVDHLGTSSDYLKALHYQGYSITKLTFNEKKTVVQKLVTGESVVTD